VNDSTTIPARLPPVHATATGKLAKANKIFSHHTIRVVLLERKAFRAAEKLVSLRAASSGDGGAAERAAELASEEADNRLCQARQEVWLMVKESHGAEHKSYMELIRAAKDWALRQGCMLTENDQINQSKWEQLCSDAESSAEICTQNQRTAVARRSEHAWAETRSGALATPQEHRETGVSVASQLRVLDANAEIAWRLDAFLEEEDRLAGNKTRRMIKEQNLAYQRVLEHNEAAAAAEEVLQKRQADQETAKRNASNRLEGYGSTHDGAMMLKVQYSTSALRV
jgi:hypothetical protein